MSRKTIRVFLIDDHAIIAAGVESILASAPGIELVGHAKSARDAWVQLDSVEPDVVLLDISLKDESWTAHEAPLYASELIRAGAVGYVTKGTSTREIIHAITRAAEGETYICEEMVEKIILDKEGRVQSLLDTLNRREREVVRMIADGYTLERIEQALDLDRRTLTGIRARVFRKLGVETEAQLTRTLHDLFPRGI